MRNGLIQASYIIAALLFVLGLRRMSSPKTARGGIQWAGIGMVLATIATFFWSGLTNYVLMAVAIVLGGAISLIAAERVRMTDMPQMIALFNGMGGGAAAAISAVELMRGEAGGDVVVLAVLGGIIGTVSFSGSLIAFAKLQGLLKRSVLLPGRNVVNMTLLAAALAVAGLLIAGFGGVWIALLFALSFVFGVLMTLPIGGRTCPW